MIPYFPFPLPPSLSSLLAPPQVSAYALSWLIAELPYVLILVGTFLNVFYWACGYSRDADRFFMYWLFLWEVVTFYTYFGQFIGTLPYNQSATNLSSSHVQPHVLSTLSPLTRGSPAPVCLETTFIHLPPRTGRYPHRLNRFTCNVQPPFPPRCRPPS